MTPFSTFEKNSYNRRSVACYILRQWEGVSCSQTHSCHLNRSWTVGGKYKKNYAHIFELGLSLFCTGDGDLTNHLV